MYIFFLAATAAYTGWWAYAARQQMRGRPMGGLQLVSLTLASWLILATGLAGAAGEFPLSTQWVDWKKTALQWAVPALWMLALYSAMPFRVWRKRYGFTIG